MRAFFYGPPKKISVAQLSSIVAPAKSSMVAAETSSMVAEKEVQPAPCFILAIESASWERNHH